MREPQADRVGTLTLRAWPVEYLAPISTAQAALGMLYLLETIRHSALNTSVGLAVRAGGGRPTQAWFTASHLAGSAPEPVATLVKSCATWLGINRDNECTSLPDLTPTAGVAFAMGAADSRRVSTRQSTLWRALAASAGEWQLTVVVSPRDNDRDLVDLSLSLIGSGEEIYLVPALLGADALEDEAMGLEHRYVEGAELAHIAELATRGQAPILGAVPDTLAARLLATPARISGQWLRLSS